MHLKFYQLFCLFLFGCLFQLSAQKSKTLNFPEKPDKEAFVPNRIIMKLSGLENQFIPAQAHSKARLSSSFHFETPYTVRQIFHSNSNRAFGLENILEISFQEDVDIFSIIHKLKENPNVIYATPQLKYKSDGISSAYYSPPSSLYTPNDPMFVDQWNLLKVHAPEAWEISRGDTNTIIGIIDTEMDWKHEDLIGKIKYNYADPFNGIDDDENGLVDDFAGWDFADGDSSTINLVHRGLFHGTAIGSIAAAETDNSTGIAGTCPSCLILPIKCAQDTDLGQFLNNVEGIAYAVDHGARVLNCSWGSFFPDPYTQDLIAYAIDHDVLVVCAAGNDNSSLPFYPADFDGVIKVAATDQNDKKVSYSNYGPTVDVSCPTLIPAAFPDNKYGEFSGTSSASPMVAGLGALLRSKFPQYDAPTIAELIRKSCDPIDQLNQPYKGQLGAGRINMFKAITQHYTSVRVLSNEYTDLNGGLIEQNDTIQIAGILKNYFDTLRNVTVRLVSTSPYIKYVNDEILIPQFDAHSNLDLKDNPFEIVVSADAPLDQSIEMHLAFETADYNDEQKIPDLLVNQSFIHLDINRFSTKVNTGGRFGFHKEQIIEGDQLMYDGKIIAQNPVSLMLGSSPTQLSSSVLFFQYDDEILTSFSDFKALDKIALKDASGLADIELNGHFDNSFAGIIQSLDIQQRILGWNDNADQDFFITEYTIQNKRPNSYENFYVGLFNDVQISDFGFSDFIDEDSNRRLGFGYDFGTSLFFGIELLTPLPFHHYAIDINEPADNIYLDDGLSKLDQYLSMQLQKSQAGFEFGGSEVSQVVSTGPYSLGGGQTISAAFAIIAAPTLDDLLLAADNAQAKYDGLISAVSPVQPKEINTVYAYPNPTSGMLSIHTDQAELAGIQLYNAEGKLVNAYNGKTELIDISDMPTGTYILTFKTDKQVMHQKIVLR